MLEKLTYEHRVEHLHIPVRAQKMMNHGNFRQMKSYYKVSADYKKNKAKLA